MTDTEMRMYDMVVELGICTPEELNLVRNVLDGSWKFVIESVIYARTGERTLEQYLERIMEDDEED